MQFDLPFGGCIVIPTFPAIPSTSVRPCYPIGKFLRKLLNPFESIDEACTACSCGVDSQEADEAVETIDVERVLAECDQRKVFIFERVLSQDGVVTYVKHGPFDLQDQSDVEMLWTFHGRDGFHICG
jgi:hypothetical protein